MKFKIIILTVLTIIIFSGCSFFSDMRLKFVNQTDSEALDLYYRESGTVEYQLALEGILDSQIFLMPEKSIYDFKVIGSDTGLTYGTADDMDMRMSLSVDEYDFQIWVTGIGYVYFE